MSTAKPTVLVTDADQRSTLAGCRGLDAAGYRTAVVASTRPALTHWSRSCDERIRAPDPLADPAGFTFALERVVADGDYAALLPGTDQALLAVSVARDRLERHVDLGLPPHDVVVRCLDKLALVEVAAEAGLPCPSSVACVDEEEVLSAAAALGFPVALKPASSLVHSPARAWRQAGGVVPDEQVLRAALPVYGMPVIVQRYQPAGRVFSCAGVITDGRLLAVAASRYRRTWPPRAGSASFSEATAMPEEAAARVATLLRLLGWQGIFEVELLEEPDGSLATIDLNPRLYGSMTLAIRSGVNLPALWCDWLLGRPLTAGRPRPGLRYRWEEGELRNAARALRAGQLGTVLEIARPRRAAVHAYFELTDPLPLVAWSSRAVVRAVRARPRRSRVAGAAASIALAGSAAEIVTEPSALAELAPEWRRLAEDRGNAFVTPEWYESWLRVYGDRYRPYVAVLRAEDGSVRGILPLAISGARPRWRTVTFAGAGLGDQFHPVAAPEDEEAVAVAAGLALTARGRDWGTLALHNVEPAQPWVRALIQPEGRRLATVWHEETPLPYHVLPDTWGEFLAARSRNFRSELGRKLRRLERDHEVGFRRTTDPATLDRDLDVFFALHDRRWSPRGGSSIAAPRARAFHRDFAAAALERDWLRLWFLEVDGTPVSVWYGWLLGGRYAYYLAGFDPDWSEHSVGLLLLAHTVRDAIQAGATEYDLLLGGEPYKGRFATSERTVRTVVAAPPLHPQRVAAGIEVTLREAGRRLPEPVRSRVRQASAGLLRRFPGARER